MAEEEISFISLLEPNKIIVTAAATSQRRTVHAITLWSLSGIGHSLATYPCAHAAHPKTLPCPS